MAVPANTLSAEADPAVSAIAVSTWAVPPWGVGCSCRAPARAAGWASLTCSKLIISGSGPVGSGSDSASTRGA